jgi:hypothetical protein
MAATELTVTCRSTVTSPPKTTTWEVIASALVGELPHPERAELIITDRYEQISGELAVLSQVRANEDMTTTDYRAGQPGGVCYPQADQVKSRRCSKSWN